MQSQSRQPTFCVTWCLIWWFPSLEKYGHTWHWMSLLRPGVIKQHKPNPLLCMGLFCWQFRAVETLQDAFHHFLNLNSYSACHGNWCTVGGDGGCRVGEVRAGTTSPMLDHKGFNLQELVNFQKFSTLTVNIVVALCQVHIYRSFVLSAYSFS